jgi:hypothetical protein
LPLSCACVRGSRSCTSPQYLIQRRVLRHRRGSVKQGLEGVGRGARRIISEKSPIFFHRLRRHGINPSGQQASTAPSPPIVRISLSNSLMDGTLNRAYGFPTARSSAQYTTFRPPPTAPLRFQSPVLPCHRSQWLACTPCPVTSNPMRFQFQFSPPRASHPLFENSTGTKKFGGK